MNDPNWKNLLDITSIRDRYLEHLHICLKILQSKLYICFLLIGVIYQTFFFVDILGVMNFFTILKLFGYLLIINVNINKISENKNTGHFSVINEIPHIHRCLLCSYLNYSKRRKQRKPIVTIIHNNKK